MASTLPSIADCCNTCCAVQIVDLPTHDGGTGSPMWAYETLDDLRNETRVTVLVDDTMATVYGKPTQGAEDSGFFYYDSTSVLPDDGSSVIQPSSIVGGAPGRWLKFKG